MPLIITISLSMLAFAFNSILNRMAVGGGFIDPASFAAIRVCSGAAFLSILLLMRGKPVFQYDGARLWGALSLAAYMIGFSLAYRQLDAGLGALILFGVVQMALFLYTALYLQMPLIRQLTGALIAFGGLLLLFWPNSAMNIPFFAALWMGIAGVAWAIYTLSGRHAKEPLVATSSNFILAVPVLCIFAAFQDLNFDFYGFFLAMIAGAVTSGLGYTIWYAVLPRITPATAAVLQLSVPVIAMVAGAVFLRETVLMYQVAAAVLVLGGIALSLVPSGKQSKAPE